MPSSIYTPLRGVNCSGFSDMFNNFGKFGKLNYRNIIVLVSILKRIYQIEHIVLCIC